MKYLNKQQGVDCLKKHSERLGESKVMKCGLLCTIIEYNNYNNVIVEFENNNGTKKITYNQFLKGNVKPIENIIGEVRIMNDGNECKVVEYKNKKNIIVEFTDTKERVKASYHNFKRGGIKSHFSPTVCGVGIVGLETTSVNGVSLPSYECWRDMLRRCYDEKRLKTHPTYIGCEVCEEWKYYPNFKKWYEDNFYKVEGQRTHLDKDILFKGNKLYSPETCVFVPERINTLFVKKDANRGNLPIGVVFHKRDKVYEVKVSSSKSYCGRFYTQEEAFNTYKQEKENYIKEVAEQYKNIIPHKLYEAMYEYEVDIND